MNSGRSIERDEAGPLSPSASRAARRSRRPTPETILVYISSGVDNALGENIIKLPLLRGLRQAYPHARIAWAGGLGPIQFAGPLKPLADGYIDELVEVRIGEAKSAPFQAHPLPGRRFDLIVDAQRLVQRTLALMRIPHRRLVSGTWRFWLSNGRPAPGHPRTPRLVEKLLAVLSAAIEAPAVVPHIHPLPPAWHEAAARLLPPGPVYVGLAPGAGRRDTGKCWPLDRYIAVADAQVARGRTPVFFLGPAEAAWVPELRQRFADAVFPDCALEAPDGALGGPAMTVALGGRLAAAVANCSGTGHMLATGGAPMVSLFGPTNPAKYAPYTPDLTVLAAQSFGGDGIDRIPVEAVAAGVEARIAAGRSPRSAARQPVPAWL